MISLDQAAEAFQTQAGFCTQLGSPFTARVLRVLAENIRANGPMAQLVKGFEEEPVAAALALRVAGAFHRRALNDVDGALAAIYPTCGGNGAGTMDDEALCALLLRDLQADQRHYQAYLESPPQTNEVGRSGVMIGGYLTIASETRLPLDVCEIGASAGLNLGFDKFYYELGGVAYGDARSPVKLAPDWHGSPPPVDVPLSVRSRSACDIAPLNVHDLEAQRRLESYIWGDQHERMARLRGAIALACGLGVTVVPESADRFVARALQSRKSGSCCVIAHTVMWQYMPTAMRNSIERMIYEAGAQSTSEAPVAWLRLEPKDLAGPPSLQLRIWPGDGERDLAIAHPHGASVKWL